MTAVPGLYTTPVIRKPPAYLIPRHHRGCGSSFSVPINRRCFNNRLRIRSSNSDSSDATGIQVYRDFERYNFFDLKCFLFLCDCRNMLVQIYFDSERSLLRF